MVNLEYLENLRRCFEFIGGENKKIKVVAPKNGAIFEPFTGDIAKSLGEKLCCPTMILNNIEQVMDITKDQLIHNKYEDRLISQEYKDMVFQDNPQFVIIIRGQQNPRYDLEISTGFNLEFAKKDDRILWKKLTMLKEIWQKKLKDNWQVNQQLPTIGLYPIDKDVKFKGQGTYILQIIKEQRNQGVNICGLSINIDDNLRIKEDRLNQEAIVVIEETLEKALRRSFFNNPLVF